MATTYELSGSLSISHFFQVAFETDASGGYRVSLNESIVFNDAGGSEPDIQGFFKGTGSISASTDLLLAHASDPLQGAGDATYSPGFTVAGSKLKFLYIKNTDDTESLTISRGAANGLPVFDAAGDAITLPPGGIFLFYPKTGTAALTTGSNDKLTVAPSANTVTFDIVAGYGG